MKKYKRFLKSAGIRHRSPEYCTQILVYLYRIKSVNMTRMRNCVILLIINILNTI